LAQIGAQFAVTVVGSFAVVVSPGGEEAEEVLVDVGGPVRAVGVVAVKPRSWARGDGPVRAELQRLQAVAHHDALTPALQVCDLVAEQPPHMVLITP
jgi:hypothetical protein